MDSIQNIEIYKEAGNSPSSHQPKVWDSVPTWVMPWCGDSWVLPCFIPRQTDTWTHFIILISNLISNISSVPPTILYYPYISPKKHSERGRSLVWGHPGNKEQLEPSPLTPNYVLFHTMLSFVKNVILLFFWIGKSYTG